MDDFKAPKDLQRRVRNYLKEQPTLRWDAALAEIIKQTSSERRQKKKHQKRRLPGRGQ
jgi:hypothetical protein